ncbi:MAG: N-acetylneuraminate synthase [Phototrophicaceae bacterium]
MNEFTIDGQTYSNTRVFIIAEAGVNHNGDLALAKQLVDIAAKAKADAVKFQTFKAGSLVTKDAAKATYQQKNTQNEDSQFSMLKKLELSYEMHKELQDYCQQEGIIFLSTPFDEDSVDLLVDLDLPVFKIGSGDLTNIPMLEYVASKNIPLIISTGMSYLADVEEALIAIEGAGNPPVAVLHCVSNYPADDSDVNLHAMLTMKEAFGIPVGYSDHTPGIPISLAAVALGASIIEKHITIDRTLPGPDHRASLEPDEFAELVAGIRRIEQSIGTGRKVPSESEKNTADVARRSIFAKTDISAGTIITKDHIIMKRPSSGLPPKLVPYVLGLKAKHDISADTALSFEILE